MDPHDQPARLMDTSICPPQRTCAFVEAALLEEEAAKFGAAINFTTGAAQDHYAFPGPQAIPPPHNNYHPPPAVCGVPNLALPVLPAFYVPPLGPVEMFKFT
ncbi:unnamed protein product [Vitrella brassicaformis CCMP3155]|uniref:Uncharacterized protein n=1 Tax=Vitrella brassicaformis (strain CCMP3155) TaxID=1169540 RepID=A0A0G4ECF3_VITBC|nr:unnamed protein product [Vitrella brassicaformis CCMP3155]|eukprot:CEL93200.1 unnamed protein product [Vitrella brassicaformis CCMP3155]